MDVFCIVSRAYLRFIKQAVDEEWITFYILNFTFLLTHIGIYFMKTLKSLALASLLVAPMVGNASTFADFGSIAAGSTYSFSSPVVSGSFTNDYDFTSAGFVTIDTLITALGKTVKGVPVLPIAAFSATLDGVALIETDTINPAGVSKHYYTQALFNTSDSLASMLHHLIITGTSLPNYSYTGSIDVTSVAADSFVSAVPLPTSVWLFMTGMMGLLYAGKKKSQLVSQVS